MKGPALLVLYYFLGIILGLFLIYDLWELETEVLVKLSLPVSLTTYIGMIIALFTLICLWIIFRKEGRPGWAAIVPIYNGVVLCQIAGYSGRYVWLFFIPIFNIVAIYRVCLGLAKTFGQSKRFGLCLFLFSLIFLPILAFSKKVQHDHYAKMSAPIQTVLPSTREYFERKAVRECFVRAGELEAAGEREKAIEQYAQTISLDSRHTVAYFKRGMLLMDSGAKAAAVADFRRVIEIADNPELAELAEANIAKLV